MHSVWTVRVVLNPSSFCRFLRSGPGPFHCSSQADYFIWRGLCHFHRCMARCPWAWETLWHHPQCLEHPMLGLWPPLLEVDVSGKIYWELGLTYPSISRKGQKEDCWLGRHAESWCLEYFDGDYNAWHGGTAHTFAHFHLLSSDRYFLQLSWRSGDIFRGG